jgi:hypothetical protein
MELVVVELDAGTEPDATEYTEVAGVELVGGIDFGSGRGRRMEHGRGERRESGQRRHWGHAGAFRPASHEWGWRW